LFQQAAEQLQHLARALGALGIDGSFRNRRPIVRQTARLAGLDRCGIDWWRLQQSVFANWGRLGAIVLLRLAAGSAQERSKQDQDSSIHDSLRLVSA